MDGEGGGPAIGIFSVHHVRDIDLVWKENPETSVYSDIPMSMDWDKLEAVSFWL